MTIGHTAAPYVRIVMDDGLAHEIGAQHRHSCPRTREGCVPNLPTFSQPAGGLSGERQSSPKAVTRPDSFQPCPECDGTGEVIFIALDSTRYEIGECPDCDGTGLVEAACGVCEGPLTASGYCFACDAPDTGWAALAKARGEVEL